MCTYYIWLIGLKLSFIYKSLFSLFLSLSLCSPFSVPDSLPFFFLSFSLIYLKKKTCPSFCHVSYILDLALWCYWACSTFLCKCWALMETQLSHFVFDFFFNLHKYLSVLHNFKSHFISCHVSFLMLRFRGYWFHPSIFKFCIILSPSSFNGLEDHGPDILWH